MAKAKSSVRFRSAKTGVYVTQLFAKRHPNTTVKEATLKKGKK